MSLGDYPIVSLDKIYLTIDNEFIYFLDCTRLNGNKNLVARQNMNDPYSVDNQIKTLSNYFKSLNITDIVIADDVLFSGTVLREVIKKFKENNINVIGIRCCISSIEGYDYFNQILPLGVKCDYVLGSTTIDQICERDFYFGIVGSGIATKTKEGIIKKAPYFYPFGDPIKRASIPEDKADYFSNTCLTRSLLLWSEINRLSNKNTLINELPEQIINTQENESVTYTLKKGIK